MKITANKYVAVTYDLNVGEGEERELMEKATVEAPLKFIYGTGMMLPAFEKALNGLEEVARSTSPSSQPRLMANITRSTYWIFRRISSRWTVN